MTAASHNDLVEHATSQAAEDRPTALVHTPWAGWYYEGSATEVALAAA